MYFINPVCCLWNSLTNMNILCVFGFSSPFYVLTSVIDCLTRAKLAVLNSLSFVYWATAEVHHYYLFIYCLFVNNFKERKKKKGCCHSSLSVWNCDIGTVFLLWCYCPPSSLFTSPLERIPSIFFSLKRIIPVCFSCAHHFRIYKCN